MPELTLYEALAGLFTSAFVSATLFPGASEAVLLALVHAWPDEMCAAISGSFPRPCKLNIGGFQPAAERGRKQLPVCLFGI